MHAEHRARYNAAIRDRETEKAVKAAQGMRDCGYPLDPIPATRLLALLFEAGDRRADRFAARWLERLQLGERDRRIAAVAFEGLREPGAARRCEEVLRALVPTHARNLLNNP